tara:strand:+ start:117 stop:602 length:486 start_codon:yes stop_codon:yes gene_type:complete
MSNGKDYEVGYGKPPKHTQFRKGKSGNPRGRPKGSKNTATIMTELLARKVPVKQNGEIRNLSLREALLTKLAAKAMEGNTRDLIALFKLVEQYIPTEVAPAPEMGFMQIEYVLPEGKTVEDYERQDNWRGRDWSREEKAAGERRAETLTLSNQTPRHKSDC